MAPARGWSGEQLYDDADGTAASAYGVSSFPFMVFLDSEGHVVKRLAGEQEPTSITAAVTAATS